MIRYLLDTDVLSEPAKSKPDPLVLHRLMTEEHRCATSSIVWMELMFGVLRLVDGRRRRRLAAYVDDIGARFPILPFATDDARWLAVARVYQQQRGVTRPRYDSLIAATAASRGLTLVTRNGADFADFPGLTVARWHS